VCYEQRGHPQIDEELVQLGPDRATGVRIEGGQRLVQEQDVGLARERPRQRDALALASREVGRPSVGEPGDPQSLEQLGNDVAATRSKGDVAAHVEMREQRVLLEHEPDTPSLGRKVDLPRSVEPGLVAVRDHSLLRTEKSGNGAQNARLARAGGADERNGLRADLER
jgi:hypothetical protein